MIRILTCWILLLNGAAFAQSVRPDYGGPLKPEQANMDVKHYTIDLALDIPGRSVAGYAIIRCDLLQPATSLLFDLMDSFRVSAVSVNGKAAEFTHQRHELHITTAKVWPAGLVTVRVQYAGHPMIAKRPPWDDGFTFTTDSTGHPWVAVTAEGTGERSFSRPRTILRTNRMKAWT
jgi:aminopeptidase N